MSLIVYTSDHKPPLTNAAIPLPQHGLPSPAHQPDAPRRFTSKQVGDACEMLVAAELTLAGIPALKVPDNWPHYDVVAQPIGEPPQRISVKSRTYKRGAAFVEYNAADAFDWLAIVLLDAGAPNSRSTYIVPRSYADRFARQDKPTSKTAGLRYFRIDEVDRLFSIYRDNFSLLDLAAAPATPL